MSDDSASIVSWVPKKIHTLSIELALAIMLSSLILPYGKKVLIFGLLGTNFTVR